jgi:hypothetical protein
MCCCGKPVINGQIGYKWQHNDSPVVRPVHPPVLGEEDTLIYDEPGRCGELDCHSHHYQLVERYGSIFLAVQHGAGKESLRISDTKTLLSTLSNLDSNGRYWLFHAIYHAASEAARYAEQKTNGMWRMAAVNKRIKTRKSRSGGNTKVWIEPATKDTVGFTT